MSQEFNVGDEVEVTFKGKVYEYNTPNMQETVSFNHVAVSSGGFIHHIHKTSPDIVKVTPPRAEMELGQVWIAGTDKGNRTFLVYSDNMSDELILVGTRDDENHKLIYSEAEFFKTYPGASLATVTV